MTNALTFLENSWRDRKLWLVAYVATIFIPWALIFSRGTADVSCSLIGLIFMWKSTVNKSWHWRQDPLVKTGFLAWAWLVLIASPFAVNPMESFATALPWIRFIVLYAALRYFVLTEHETLRYLALSLALLIAFVGIDTLWQYVFGISLSGRALVQETRLSGPLDNIKVGIYLARMIIPAAALWVLFSLKKPSALLALLSFAGLYFIDIIVMLSGERTAFFSVTTVTFLLSLVSILLYSRQRKYLAMIFVLWVAALGLLATSQPSVQHRTGELHQTIENFKASPYGQLFQAGYYIGVENIITGAGLKGFRELCPALIAQEKISYCNLHPHNPYIEWFSEAGLVGLVLFIAMIVSMAYICIQHLRRAHGAEKILPLFAIGCLFNHFFPLMATQSNFSNWPGILLWYSVSLSLASLNAVEKKVA